MHSKMARLSGMPAHTISSPLDHNPRTERCAGMSDAELRKFFKEEQKEGMHPSLKGKKF